MLYSKKSSMWFGVTRSVRKIFSKPDLGRHMMLETIPKPRSIRSPNGQPIPYTGP